MQWALAFSICGLLYCWPVFRAGGMMLSIFWDAGKGDGFAHGFIFLHAPLHARKKGIY